LVASTELRVGRIGHGRFLKMTCFSTVAAHLTFSSLTPTGRTVARVVATGIDGLAAGARGGERQ
jgi:hypothetical protein